MTDSKAACPTPVVHALLICDYVMTDSLGKNTVIGTFTNIGVKKDFPATHGPLGIFLMLGDMAGRYSISISFHRVQDDHQLAKFDLGAESKDRHAIIPVGLNVLPGLVFPNPGKYVVKVIANGEFLHDRVFEVRKVE